MLPTETYFWSPYLRICIDTSHVTVAFTCAYFTCLETKDYQPIDMATVDISNCEKCFFYKPIYAASLLLCPKFMLQGIWKQCNKNCRYEI